MSYDIDKLNQAVNDAYGDFDFSDNGDYNRPYSRDAWGALYLDLLNKEAVKIPDIGWAHYADADVESDYYTEGDIWFIFKVHEKNGTERFFRKAGFYSSYDGRQFDHITEEVAGRQVIKTEWTTK